MSTQNGRLGVDFYFVGVNVEDEVSGQLVLNYVVGRVARVRSVEVMVGRW